MTGDATLPTILLVEDDELIVDSVRYGLEQTGYQVLTALDGATGLALAREKQPDIVLLDVMLPVLDGFQVCRTLRNESKVPIIMLTARGEEPDKVIGLELGADDYVVKPFGMRELVARIRAQLRRTEMESEPAQANQTRLCGGGDVGPGPTSGHQGGATGRATAQRVRPAGRVDVPARPRL